jgi:hypothetical protein
MKTTKLVATFDNYSEQDTADKLVLLYLAATHGFPTPDSLDYQAQHTLPTEPGKLGRYDGLYLSGGYPYVVLEAKRHAHDLDDGDFQSDHAIRSRDFVHLLFDIPTQLPRHWHEDLFNNCVRVVVLVLEASSHARTAFTGQATEPQAIAMVSPAPSWSVPWPRRAARCRRGARRAAPWPRWRSAACGGAAGPARRPAAICR